MADTARDTTTPAQVVPAPCLAVEGSGCTFGGCEPPAPTCDTAAGASPPPEHSGLEWVGSPVGCAAVGRPGWLALMLLVAVALRRRAAVLLALVLAADAVAVDVDRLGYSDGRAWAAVIDGDSGEPWQGRVAWTSSVLSRPLVARYSDGDVVPIVALATTTALGASFTLDPRIRLGVVVPVHPIAVDGGGTSVVATPGDVGLSFGVPMSRDDARLQTSWRVNLEVPTGAPERFLGGRGSGLAGLAARLAASGGVDVGAHLGVRLRPVELLSATAWGNAVEYGAAAAVRPVDALELAAELFGSVGLADDTRASLPLEALLTTRWPADGRTSVQAGAGGGLGRGLGNPKLRVLVGLEWASGAPRDTDGDGYPDLRDLCARRPEDRDEYHDLDGCPDLDDDRDTIVDADDACRLAPEVFNGWDDADGCPDARAAVAFDVGPSDLEAAEIAVDGLAPFVVLPDEPHVVEVDPGPLAATVSADGYAPQAVSRLLGEGPTTIRVRLERLPEGTLTVRVRDEAGAPVVAAVRVEATSDPTSVDGVAADAVSDGGEAVIPFPAGPVSVHVAAEGFVSAAVPAQSPAAGTALVEVVLHRPAVAAVGHTLVTSQPVRFALDEAALDPAADPALDALAAWLAAHPEVVLLRVEGHADDPGSSRYNLDLSQRRADAVVAALVARGVAPERLVALGSGEALRPSEAATARIVAFLVLVWDDDVAATPSVLP